MYTLAKTLRQRIVKYTLRELIQTLKCKNIIMTYIVNKHDLTYEIMHNINNKHTYGNNTHTDTHTPGG